MSWWDERRVQQLKEPAHKDAVVAKAQQVTSIHMYIFILDIVIEEGTSLTLCRGILWIMKLLVACDLRDTQPYIHPIKLILACEHLSLLHAPI